MERVKDRDLWSDAFNKAKSESNYEMLSIIRLMDMDQLTGNQIQQLEKYVGQIK